MASVAKTYRVMYHFETSGKKSSSDYAAYIQASASDYTTLKGVLSSNSLLLTGALVLDSVQEVGHADVAIA
ncbi:MAG: hypothetical protein ACLP3K_11595 [Candidatus Acidiferrales bacterium]